VAAPSGQRKQRADHSARACAILRPALLSGWQPHLLFAYPIGQRSCVSGVRSIPHPRGWVELHNFWSGYRHESKFFLPTGGASLSYAPTIPTLASTTPHRKCRRQQRKEHFRRSTGNVVSDSAWSPDGKAIVGTIFDQAEDSISGAVISIDPDTGAQRTISRPPYTMLTNVSWLPDGRALAVINQAWKQNFSRAAGWADQLS